MIGIRAELPSKRKFEEISCLIPATQVNIKPYLFDELTSIDDERVDGYLVQKHRLERCFTTFPLVDSFSSQR